MSLKCLNINNTITSITLVSRNSRFYGFSETYILQCMLYVLFIIMVGILIAIRKYLYLNVSVNAITVTVRIN